MMVMECWALDVKKEKRQKEFYQQKLFETFPSEKIMESESNLPADFDNRGVGELGMF